MRYHLIVLPFILSVIAQEVDVPPPEKSDEQLPCNSMHTTCRSISTGSSQNSDAASATHETVSFSTVVAVKTILVDPSPISSINEGSTSTTLSVSTSFSSETGSSWKTAPTTSPSSSTSEETTTTTTSKSKASETSTKESETSAAPKPSSTDFAPPENDKELKEKVVQAAADVKEAGVFALFGYPTQTHLNFGVDWEEKKSIGPPDSKEAAYKWILLDDSVNDKFFTFNSTHFGRTGTSGATYLGCSLKLKPLEAGKYAYIQATYSGNRYVIEDDQCVMDINCGGGWSKKQEDLDKC